MKLKGLFWLFAFLLPSFFLSSSDGLMLEVYTDRHGTWRVPSEGIPTKITRAIIKAMPRIDNSFSQVDLVFDMDNDVYFNSSAMYILIIGLIGIVYLLIVVAFFVGRYLFNGCGGKQTPKKGYKPSQVNCARSFLVFFSFILEGALIYGYFANTDLHKSLQILVDQFQATSESINQQLSALADALPSNDQVLGGQYSKSLFQTDLEFSSRFAKARSANMKETLDNYETYRMLLIIFNLVLATLGCAVGVAAGSIHKGLPVIIMLGLHGVGGTLIFFSFGAHFAAAKILYEYCDEIEYYLSDNNDEFIPMRLQYWYPCASSPVFPFIWNYFSVTTLMHIEDLRAEFPALFEDNPVQWYNVTADTLRANDVVAKSQSYKETVEYAEIMQIIDDSRTCRWTKGEMRLDNFLMCSYTRDNLDMIMVAQGMAAVLIVILTFIAIPAIKKFEWSGIVPGMGGVLNGGQAFRGRPAKAKRTIG